MTGIIRLTVKDYAHRVGITPNAVYIALREGRFPYPTERFAPAGGRGQIVVLIPAGQMPQRPTAA